MRSLLTLVFYLNDGFEGGETDFPELECLKSWIAEQGAAGPAAARSETKKPTERSSERTLERPVGC